MKDRLSWYRTAIANIGLSATVRLQLQKRLRRLSQLQKLTSKSLSNPVFARPGSSDLMVFGQVIVEREYRCLDEVSDAGLIIDCGANVGYSSAYFLTRWPTCYVVAVEPDPDNYKILVKNLEPYHGRCTTIQAAVWPHNERIKLNRSLGLGNEWGQSVDRVAAAEECEDVTPVSIPMIMATSGRDRVSILKIDIEGAERELFDADVSWLNLVDNMVIELHGEHCARSFFAAIGNDRFDVTTCGELTVCLNRAHRSEAQSELMNESQMTSFR
jgi:FkbM family methyltransferase